MTTADLVTAAITEREFQRQVVDLARLTGWKIWWVHDSRHSPKGWPDLILARPPKLLALEVKSARGRLTREQDETLTWLAACGIEAAVVRPSDWEWVVATLTAPR